MLRGGDRLAKRILRPTLSAAWVPCVAVPKALPTRAERPMAWHGHDRLAVSQRVGESSLEQARGRSRRERGLRCSVPSLTCTGGSMPTAACT